MSYTDAATALNVSTASIRNWIKSGELVSNQAGFVTSHSVDRFRTEIAGQSRLTQRANKLYIKQSRNPARNKTRTKAAQITDLSEQYENSLGSAQRNREGIYYTPPDIIDRMLSRIPGDVSEMTFLDPCCGTGNFLLGALRRGFKPQNIRGQDCDLAALSIAKQRVLEQTGQALDILECRDFLDKGPIGDTQYDVIATNPPWGKKLAPLDKRRFANAFGLKAPIGSAALFSFGILQAVKPDGFVGLLLPESCFNIATFEPLRRRLLARHILAFENHGRPFKTLLTKAQSVIFQNRPAKPSAKIACWDGGQVHYRAVKSFQSLPKTIFNFSVTPEQTDIIAALYQQPHITLEDRVKWGLGIVTGGNKRYCHTSPDPARVPVFKGSDIRIGGLKAPSQFIDPDLSLYRQVAPSALYAAPEKLIYKFISDRPVFFLDTEQRLILNSANMLILDEVFPLNHAQLCFLLNTDLMGFIFRSIFKTRKVLRSDLSALPIFDGFFKTNLEWTEQNLLHFLGLEKISGQYHRLDG